MTGGFLYETPIHFVRYMPIPVREVATVKCEARQCIPSLNSMTSPFCLHLHPGPLGPDRLRSCGMELSFSGGWNLWQILQNTVEDMERVIYALTGDGGNDFKQVLFEEKWGYVEEDRLFVDAILNGTNLLLRPTTDISW